ncbi:MAG: hypothetical protein LBT95_04595 [Treponema sp.]|jgi:hypothetical protein|nr:hypothetical protein [Treponema sp.]
MPITFWFNQEEYTLTMINMSQDDIFLLPDRPIKGFEFKYRMGLIFNYWGKIIQFSLEVVEIVKNFVIVAKDPEFLLKSLDQPGSRAGLSPDIRALYPPLHRLSGLPLSEHGPGGPAFFV